ncbi:MAG: ABC transporter ATP-binding protein [Alicyclobacillus sp.]|nr:ABC transporter ATP-binding protein [Alicyclobacillus sp.]
MADDIRFDRVCKYFYKKGAAIAALKDVSLHVREGEFVTILGPSGCGKSTLLRIVAGLDEASEGSVTLGGQEIHGPGADRGMVFQAYTLFPWLTVRQNIEFGLHVKGMPAAQRRAVSERYLRQIGLESFADHLPKELSGGMKQRVAIARAFANDPRVLLLDEPFGALDAQTRAMMQEHVLHIWEQSGKTMLFVTHDIEEAIFMADRVVVMTRRPGTVREIVDVGLPRPRDYHVKFSPTFSQLKEHLTEAIRQESGWDVMAQ